jgi:hypothetical protein
MVVYLFRDSPPNLFLEMGGRRLELDRGDVARVEGSPALTRTDDRGREQTGSPTRRRIGQALPGCALCFFRYVEIKDGRHCGEIEG